MQTLLHRVLWIEPFWIALVAPSILFPGRFWDRGFQPALVILLFVFLPLRLFARPLNLFRTPLGYAVVGLLLWLPVTIIVSAEPSRSWEWVGYVALGVALYGALVEWPPTQVRPMLIVWLLLVIGGVLALVGPLLIGAIPDKILFLVFTRPSTAVAARQLGETMNPNVLAGALVLIAPLLGSLAISKSQLTVPSRVTIAVAAMLVTAVIVWTQSRGAYAALAISLVVVSVMQLRRRYWASFTATVIAASALLYVFKDHILSRPESTGTALLKRAEIWHRALLAVSDAPITGIGFSQFDVVIPRLYPYTTAVSIPPPHAHNLLLQIGVDTGLVGLLIMLSIWGGSFYLLFRMRTADLRGKYTTIELAAAAGAVGSLCAMLNHGMVDAVLWSSKLAFVPWLIYALIGCLYLGRLSKTSYTTVVPPGTTSIPNQSPQNK